MSEDERWGKFPPYNQTVIGSTNKGGDVPDAAMITDRLNSRGWDNVDCGFDSTKKINKLNLLIKTTNFK